MNSVVRQMWEQNTDIVLVDTGNSYEGLCEYVGGKYISYTDEHPITMNPFRIKREEYNIEKIGFLKNLSFPSSRPLPQSCRPSPASAWSRLLSMRTLFP